MEDDHVWLAKFDALRLSSPLFSGGDFVRNIAFNIGAIENRNVMVDEEGENSK